MAGIDPLALPIDRFLSLVYHLLIDGADETERRKLDARLHMPPKGVAVTQGPWSPAAETSALSAFSAQMRS